MDHARSLCDKLVDVKKWVVGFVLFLLVSACAQGEPPNSNPDGTVNCSYRVSGQAAKPTDPPPQGRVPATGEVVVTMQMGGAPVTITLDRSKAPCTVNSFESLAKQGYFDGTACHRLSTQGIFILQCGDPTGTGRGGPGYVFNDELGQTRDYPAGTVAMANSGPNTNGSQFFFVYQDTPLPPQYTVFGTIDQASVQHITDIAFLGHDGRYPDRTGFPNGEATITGVSVG